MAALARATQDDEDDSTKAEQPASLSTTPPSAEMEALNALYEEFQRADYEGKIRICRRAIEEEMLDGELAFEFFNSLYYTSVEHGERERFDELAALLRQRQPDVYAEEALYLLDWQITNALVAGRTEDLQTLADSLVEAGPRNVDTFSQVLDQLAYHEHLDLLLKVTRGALEGVRQTDILPWGLDEYEQRLLDYIVFDHIERHGPAAALATERFDGLVETLSDYTEIDRDKLAEYVARIGGQQQRQWRLEDFDFDDFDDFADFDGDDFDENKWAMEDEWDDEEWDDEEWDDEDEPNPAAINLSQLTQEFLGYLRFQEDVSFPKGELGRGELFRYLHMRAIGELGETDNGASRGKKRKTSTKLDTPPAATADVLLPDRSTLDRFLAGFFDLLQHNDYRATAMLEVVPAWLRFLGRRGLIDVEQGKQTLASLTGLDTSLLKIWGEHPSDPLSVRNLETWREERVG